MQGEGGSPLVLEGTLHGGSSGCQSQDVNATGSTGGLRLHSLKGILFQAMEDGEGGVPDQVKQRLADLKRLWGRIQQGPVQSMSETAASQDMAAMSTASASAVGQLDASAVCQLAGAVVQCRACKSAVTCDSSSVLAWLHGGQSQTQNYGIAARGSSGEEGLAPSPSGARAGEYASAKECSARSVFDSVRQQGPTNLSTALRASPQKALQSGVARGSDLREALSPAGACAARRPSGCVLPGWVPRPSC